MSSTTARTNEPSTAGSLPPDKAGVGSAMNDTTREVGGALGVAILGSIATAVYSSQIAAQPDFATLQAASPDAAAAVQDSVGSAALVAEQLPADLASQLVSVANDAFVHALDRAVIVGAVVALAGALVALRFLPARARADDAGDRLVEGASARLLDDPEQRLGLARTTLGLLAEAGMSSLTYNAVAARSGIGTATLARHWTSRVDAVTDAVGEIFAAHPVPDTGDLRADLRTYLRDVAGVLGTERARRVVGALMVEAGSDPDLAAALRERVIEPRRACLAARLTSGSDGLAVPVDAAIDQLIGPIYARVLIAGQPPDDGLVDATVAGVVRDTPSDGP